MNQADYDAVFYPGGHGPLWDLASSEISQKLITSFYTNNKPIAFVCHAPGVLKDVKVNGDYLVKGKKVAGFPNSTELDKPWAKNGTLLPFLIESRLRENGALAQNKDTLADKHDVVIDQRIVSTMFLPSAALVAKEMLILLEQDSKLAGSRGAGSGLEW